ncbi:MAG TPA: Gfo/Idh/MocA family oxidoreductase [Candidatus Krumholzibacteriaceae bacterium]|nr:Gfo/Idh/MocA family oxidoreductase [Candidatus Krumholzibacteriaceae bacterium]
MLTVGIIGCGYWGPNLIRNFINLDDVHVKTCADLLDERLNHMKKIYQSIETTKDYRDIINDSEIDAVVVATPVSTHFKLAEEALNSGKHVFCEKPLTNKIEEGIRLIKLADEKELTLLVGHTFVYTAAVNKMKEVIESGELGEIYYLSSSRLNLGLFQKDINVIWDLAPHDISIINYILGDSPVSVSSSGFSYIRSGIEDVGFMTLRYPGSIVANLHVSWLNPNKIRKTTVVGSKKMLVYDDISSLEKIRIYDKGVDVIPHYDTFGEFHLSYRYGDIDIPKLIDKEPLKIECQHFLDCIRKKDNPLSSGRDGLEVMLVLNSAGRSMRQQNREVEIEYPDILDN